MPPVEVKLPVCGDGNCDASESCSECAADCGICPSVQSVVQSNQTAGNATKTEVTGQVILAPLDGLLAIMAAALGITIFLALRK
jgi:hypothetical protein